MAAVRRARPTHAFSCIAPCLALAVLGAAGCHTGGKRAALAQAMRDFRVSAASVAKLDADAATFDASAATFDAGAGSPIMRDAPSGTSDAGLDAASATHARDAGASRDDAGAVDPWAPSCDVCAPAESDAGDARAQAACAGVQAFARGQLTNPLDDLLADVTRRRFGVEALSGMWDSYASPLASAPTPILRVYARIGDGSALLASSDLAALGDRAYTALALHCRTVPLPDDYPSMLSEAAANGGYDATHVLMALLWLADNDCNDPTDASFHEQVTSSVASLIDPSFTSLTDLQVEAAAFLQYAGEGARIPAGFSDALIAAQLDDGGWGKAPSATASSGHTTGLAIWYLHELVFPGRTETWVTRVER